jgi:starch synthase
VIEDFLDSIGLSLEDYCQRMTGGWFFGYIEALRSVGWRSVIFLISGQIDAPRRLHHIPSGTPICALPVWKPYRQRRSRRLQHRNEGASRRGGLRHLRNRLIQELAPYAATPLVALARGLRREGCTAILTQEYEYARFDLCVLLGQMLRLPVYATFQGGDGHFGRLEDLIRPVTLRAATGLIIGAEREARRVMDRYGIVAAKIWRIPNPIDADLWRPSDREHARQALGLPAEARIVIWHGRIDMHRKGLDILLKAWERIRADRPRQDILLLLIGSGQDDSVLREQLQRMEHAGVRWVDHYELDRSVMRNYLAAADLSVLPSRAEGFPVAPLEAMGCGLPVIGTEIPAMFDIIDRSDNPNGILVPRDDPNALAEALRRLIDDPERCRALGQNARRHVAERFSIEAVGRRFGEMLTTGGD